MKQPLENQNEGVALAILEHLPCAIVVVNEEQKIVLFNAAAEKMFRCEAATVRDQNWNRLIPERCGIKLNELLGEFSKSNQAHCSIGNSEALYGIRTDGTEFLIEGSLSRIAVAGQMLFAWVIEDVKLGDNEEQRRRSLEERVRQAQKLEAVGILAGGIAHDFNNSLAGIMGSAELLQMEIAPEHPAHQFIEPIFIASRRARDLVRQILALSRRQQGEKSLQQLQPILSECFKFLRVTVPATIRITYHADRDCGAVLLNPIEFHQVIMTLCTNALEALPPQGGHLEIRLTQENVSEALVKQIPDLRPGLYARLSVRDNGRGLDAATQKNIFEPKETSLGLSVAREIVKSHQGAIFVESQPGSGSTFSVYLPVQAVPEPEPPRAQAEPLKGNGERILLVDDEESLAIITEKILKRLGYAVTRFSKSEEACECFKSDPTAFDLVITDHAMPGMSGIDLTTAMLSLRKEIPVLLISGFADPGIQEQAGRAGVCEILLKPVSIEQLSAVVQRSLANARSHSSPS